MMTLDHSITDLDFNKEGKRVAMINDDGMILISDVDTNAYISHLEQINYAYDFSTFEYKILNHLILH